MNKLITKNELTEHEENSMQREFALDQIIITDDPVEIAKCIVGGVDRKYITILYGVDITRLAMKATKNSRIINKIPAGGFFPFKTGRSLFLAIPLGLKNINTSVRSVFASLKRELK